MFDDDASTQPLAPVAPTAAPLTANNVPDIFDGEGDSNDGSIGGADSSPETSIEGPSALAAGRLKPISSQSMGSMPSMSSMPMDNSADSLMPQADDLHEPTAIKRIIIAAVILVALAGAGWAVWVYVIQKSASNPTPTTATAEPKATSPIPTPTPVAPVDTGVNVDASAPTAPKPVATSTPDTTVAPAIPAAIPTPVLPTADTQKDSDKDGLTDVQEAKLGIDPNNPDTDGDGLTDGAEVNIWGTDPLKKDTDGDGYTDGQEVLNGYNPKGPGKLR
ncbi:MAG: hypothetical protein NT003_01300 [Candidatus Magasanikbacteria bacterium]|nr:hypothetical protein [Candidatus Magasanikbacteria bacterium]